MHAGLCDLGLCDLGLPAGGRPTPPFRPLFRVRLLSVASLLECTAAQPTKCRFWPVFFYSSALPGTYPKGQLVRPGSHLNFRYPFSNCVWLETMVSIKIESHPFHPIICAGIFLHFLLQRGLLLDSLTIHRGQKCIFNSFSKKKKDSKRVSID